MGGFDLSRYIWPEIYAGRQPQHVTRVNKEHPRSRGLIGAFSAASCHDAVNNAAVAYLGTVGPVDTTRGRLLGGFSSNVANRATINHPKIAGGAWSVAFTWKYIASASAQYLIAQGGSSTGKGWSLYAGASVNTLYLNFGSVNQYSMTTALVPNTTYRVVLTVSGNGGTAKLYLDGVKTGSDVTVGTMATPAGTSTLLGCAWNGSAYTGGLASGSQIGDVLLYDRALSAEEAAADYAEPYAILAEPLPIAWDAGEVGAASIQPTLLTNEQTFYAPTVTASGTTQTLSPSLLTNSQTFYAPTVAVETIKISDDYERSSVNASLSSVTGSGDAAVITIKPRYQYSEIVYGNRWWEFSARIDGVNGTRPTFTVLDYESGKLFGYPWESGHRCHFSYDRETWYPFDTITRDDTNHVVSSRHNTAFTQDTVYFSNSPQFSVHQIGEWIADLDATYSAIEPTASAAAFTPTSAVSDYAAQAYIADEYSTQTDELSRTIPKTPLYAFQINDTSLMPTNGTAKRIAILTSGVHAAEDIANHCLKSFIDSLLGSSTAAQALRRQYKILVYPMINAPGRAGGGWRGSFTKGNSGQYDDANRHFVTIYSELEIVDKPKAAMTTDRSGVEPDWALDFHSQIDNTWAVYTPSTAEDVFRTRQASSNAGVSIIDMGGSWGGGQAVDNYMHDTLGAKLSVTCEVGDLTEISMSAIASYHAAMVTTVSSLVDDGYIFSAVNPSLLPNSQTFFAPTVTGGANVDYLSPGLLTNSQIFFAPTVTPGSVNHRSCAVCESERFLYTDDCCSGWHHLALRIRRSPRRDVRADRNGIYRNDERRNRRIPDRRQDRRCRRSHPPCIGGRCRLEQDAAMTIAAQRLAQLSGLSWVTAAQHLVAISVSGTSSKQRLVSRSSLGTATAALHLLDAGALGTSSFSPFLLLARRRLRR